MADRWMDERDRDWRERDWRRSEAYGRGGPDRGQDRDRTGDPRRYGEERSWADAAEEDEERFEALRRRRAVYDEDEPDYGGRSNVAGGGVQADGGRGDYGYARSYRAERDREERRAWRGEGRGFGREPDRGPAEDFRRGRGGPAGGYERGYRDARADQASRESSGDFLQRAGERISAWFRGGDPMRERDAAGDPMRRYDEDRRAVEPGHRGRGPKGYRRADARISEDVHDRLTDDPWLDATHVGVAVTDGEVTLSGHVDNREAKHRAERLIEDLSGVRHVQNNLRVDPNGGFTGAGRGFGSSALEAEMRRNEIAASPGGDAGASGLSGEANTAAAAGRSTEPKPGLKPS